MDFVGDYKTKKLLAEQLRARQKALLGSQVDMGPIVTQGQGSAPTQIQANPWGALAQLGTSYFGNKAGQKAEEAEKEAAALRMQALENIMGGGQAAPVGSPPITGGVNTGGSPVQTMQGVSGPGAGAQGVGNAPAQPGAFGGGPRKLSVQELMALSDLGLPDQVLKKLAPDDPSPGAVAQASTTPQGIDAMVAIGVFSPERAKEMKANLRQQELQDIQDKKDLFLWQQQNTYRAPVQGRAPSDFEMYQRNPEEYEKYMAAKNAGKGGGKAAQKAQEAAAATQNMRNLLGEMRNTAKDPNIDAVRNQAGALLGQYDSPIAKYAGSKMMNSAGLKMQSLQLDAALAEASKLTPVSNTDFQALRARYQAAINNPKEFVKFVDEYEKFLGQYGQQPQQANEYAPNNVSDQGLYNNGSRVNKSSSGISYTVEEEE